jgi:FKBP-type peptidyl-prolyl cis-trans isomerase FkpA
MKIIYWKKWQLLILIVALGSSILSSCSYFSDYPGFKEDDSGLLYKFHEKTKSRKAEIGDFITVEMRYKTNEDSLLFDGNGATIPLELINPVFAGDINQALAMMSKGDSATFVIRADSFLLKNAMLTILPDFIDDDSRIIFNIRMRNVQSLEELELEKEKTLREGLKIEEEAINAYILENNISVNAEISGLYFIPIRSGKGQQANIGQHVSVHYTGKFLDGTIFDSSYDRGKPIEFDLGLGQVIAGWDEGIAKMKKGGKALLLIPSDLGYGTGRGQIPPYTPLVFEVELINVK